MNKNKCLDIFERYASGHASLDEIEELKTFLQKDIDLNKWLEKEIESSSEEIDPRVKMRILNNIRSQTNKYEAPTKSKEKENRLYFYLRRVSNVAAILLPFVVILGTFLYIKSQENELFEVVADMGEKANLVLPEGTKIVINSGSKISYYSDYSKKNRTIKLDGEAFFNVAHDVNKPFIVECKDIKIKVLGTSFGIKAYEEDEDISVVLNSGKIQLITPLEEISMQPNERIVYNVASQTTTIHQVNADNYTDWKQNRLRFEGSLLESIMQTISRMHNITIIFDDPSLKQQRFTGTIDNTNIESVLDAISLTSSVKFRIEEGVIHLYKKE